MAKLRGYLDDGEWKDTKTQELITMYPPAVYEGTWGQGLLAFVRQYGDANRLLWHNMALYWTANVICEKPRFVGQ